MWILYLHIGRLCKCFETKVKKYRNLSTIEAEMPKQYFCPCKNKTSPYLHWTRLQATQRLSLGSRFVSAPAIRHNLDWKCRVPHHRIWWKKDDCGLDNFQSRCSKSSKRHPRSNTPAEKVILSCRVLQYAFRDKLWKTCTCTKWNGLSCFVEFWSNAFCLREDDLSFDEADNAQLFLAAVECRIICAQKSIPVVDNETHSSAYRKRLTFLSIKMAHTQFVYNQYHIVKDIRLKDE